MNRLSGKFVYFLFVLFAIGTTIPLPAFSQDVADTVSPEIATGETSKEKLVARNFIISTANPFATRAGYALLADGASAIDAAIAVQLVLGLVEPQSSGLGGGAFLVYWDNNTKTLTSYDGRETAPMAAGPDLFLDDNGQPLGFFDAVIGGRSVGTPGTPALLEYIHKRHGKLEWEKLFQPAIELAESGFPVSPRLNQMITENAESLFQYPQTRAYFLSEEGVPLFENTLLTNEPYAETLKIIARDGASAFYTGEIAQDIVDTVQGAAGNPGLLSLEDLANYQVKEREATCVSYRLHQICGMGPPSSGALTIGQILKLVEPYDLAEMGPDNPQSWRIIGDASRLAFADRGHYMADTDFVKMPAGLLDSNYLAERSRLLETETALPPEAVQPGNPPSDRAFLRAPDHSLELPSTSHFSIVDKAGNVVSMTTTIENGFGSRLMVRGFLLNNELTDFSFRPDVDGVPVANRVEPGKRPRSSMAPTIVLKNDSPVFAIGSPGGSRIIPYVANTLIAHIDWGMDVQQAIEFPHLVNRFGVYELEAGTDAVRFQAQLEALGYDTIVGEHNSGLHGIVLAEETLEGGADPRREGIVMGE
jgi:gamma-glutamyltranspeptidase / glutathione hydrolase